MAKTLTGFIRKTLTPLISLQLVVLSVSGIMLTWDSSIMYVMPFFILLFLSPIMYPFFLFPAGILANIMNVTSVALPRFSAFMLGMTVCYVLALLTGTTVLTFRWLYPAMQGKMFYMGLVFGIVASCAPWATLALKDRNNVFFTSAVLIMQIAGIVMGVVGVYIMKWPLEMPMINNALLMFAVMAALVSMQGWYEKNHPEEKEALFGGNAAADAEKAAMMQAEIDAEQKELAKKNAPPADSAP